VTKRAQKLYPLDDSSRCEHCGTAEKLSRHHRNGIRRDNRQENVAILCLSCHTKEEWRIKRALLAAHGMADLDAGHVERDAP
jgi:hypothetical protein